MRDDDVVMPRAEIPLLTGVGVSPAADLVFRTLTGYGPQTVTEIGIALCMPAAHVSTALDELAAVDVAEPVGVDGRTGQRPWRAQPPDVALARLRRCQQQSVNASLRARGWLARLPDLDMDWRIDRNQPMAARPLHGVARVRSRLGELVDETRHEHLSMHPEPVFTPAAVKAAAPLDQTLTARRISVCTLGVPPAEHDATRAHTQNLTRHGILYRELPSLPTKLMIFDRRVAILPLDPLDTAKGAIELTAPGVIHDVVTWFLHRWGAARPSRQGSTTMELSGRDQRIVTLLAAGHTDTSAAAQLRLSARTVAYAVRSLMDRYGVQNRFQLGLVLGASSTPHTDPSRTHRLQEPQ